MSAPAVATNPEFALGDRVKIHTDIPYLIGLVGTVTKVDEVNRRASLWFGEMDGGEKDVPFFQLTKLSSLPSYTIRVGNEVVELFSEEAETTRTWFCQATGGMLLMTFINGRANGIIRYLHTLYPDVPHWNLSTNEIPSIDWFGKLVQKK